jgi:uncharacterized protein
MLYALGGVAFEVWPLNTHEVEKSSEAGFAEKAVVGRRPILEFVGEGPQTFRIGGRLFPQKLGGLDELRALDEHRINGKALPLMRGDGTPMGWFVIESLRERSAMLDARGVGKVIEFDVSLKRADKSSGGSLFSILYSLFR